MYKKCKAIARVVKTHGKAGEVVAQNACGLPAVISPGMRVCIVPPALKGKRWRRVESVSGDAQGMLLGISGINNIDDASKIVGKTILVEAKDLPEDFYLHDTNGLIDCVVVDNVCGEIGKIQEIMQGPANDVWVVAGRFGEVLIPVVEDFIVDFIEEKHTIIVDVPYGLNEALDAEKKV